ncbi:MAG: hypothetical protein ACREVE_03190 [Gammaproteobacteria bacterium]
MPGTPIPALLRELDEVDFREFWWGSQLLERCAQTKHPDVVTALLVRHHALSNKKADSAHVLRNAVKDIDGPGFPILWSIIDLVKSQDELVSTIDDHRSLPWAAAYVLGELGGAQALSETTKRLSTAHMQLHFLTAKLAFHLTARYLQILNEQEPTVTELDIKTGQTVTVPTKMRYPDIWQREMLRRTQANEYFVPVESLMLRYLKGHLSRVSDNFVPLPKRDLFNYVDHIPTKT